MAAVSIRICLPVAEVGTNLGVGVERLDMHDVADSSSDNDHLPTIGLAHTYNATQAPVSEICIAFKNGETKWMGDLGYAAQRNPILSIKIAVLNFVKEGIHPIQTHYVPVNS